MSELPVHEHCCERATEQSSGQRQLHVPTVVPPTESMPPPEAKFRDRRNRRGNGSDCWAAVGRSAVVVGRGALASHAQPGQEVVVRWTPLATQHRMAQATSSSAGLHSPMGFGTHPLGSAHPDGGPDFCQHSADRSHELVRRRRYRSRHPHTTRRADRVADESAPVNVGSCATRDGYAGGRVRCAHARLAAA